MIIQSIKLRNIRSYSETTKIDFPVGKILFLGDIGSGKSTILQSIEFALFGTGTSSDSVRGSSLLRRSAKKGYVELAFIINNQEIIIKRTLEKTSSGVKQGNGYLVINGTKQELSPTELKAKIINLLNYPKELSQKNKSPIFRFTVYTPQEEMKKIFTMNSEERTETFRKIFQIEKYKRIRDNCLLLKQFLREKREYIQGKTSDIEIIQQQLQQINQAIQKTQEEINQQEHELSEVNLKLKEKQQQKEKLDSEQDNLNQINNQYIGITKEIQILANQIQALKKESQQTETEIQDLKQQLLKHNSPKETDEELNQQYLVLNQESTSIRIQITTLNSELEQIKKEKQQFNQKQQQMTDLKKQIQDIITEINQNKTQETIKNLTNIKQNKDIQEQINIIVNQLIKKTKELQQQIEISSNKLEEIKSQKIQIEKETYSNNNQIQQEQQILDNINNLDLCPLCLQKVTSEHKQKIQHQKQQRIQDLIEINTKNQSKINELYQQIDKIEQEIKQKTEEHEKYKSKIQELKYITQTFLSLNKEINNFKESIKTKNEQQISEKIKTLNEKLTLMQNNLKETQEKITIKNKINKLNSLISEKQNTITKNTEKIRQIKQNLIKLNNQSITLKEEKQKLEDKINQLKPIEQEYQIIKDKQSELKSKIDSQREKKRELENQKDQLKTEIESKKELLNKLEFINKTINWISDYFVPLIKNIEVHLFSTIYYQFNELFKQWFYELIEDDSLKIELSNDFSPIITQDGYDANIDDLSGGEKTSIALSYRLSLNQVINDMMNEIKTKDIIILDEPTDGFSTEQMDRVKEVLDQLDIKQIIIVSHENKIESFVDYKFRVYKDNTSSKVELIS